MDSGSSAEAGMQDGELRVDRARPTLRELALEKMREAILGLRFAPGERLIERDLCSQLGVSRTVVREVLRHLEAEGLVDNHGQRGPAVAKPTPSQAEQIYEIRAALEGMAARSCAIYATAQDITQLEIQLDAIRAAYAAGQSYRVLATTNAFYQTIFTVGGKDVAWTIVSSLNARISQLRAMTIATPGRSADGVAELERIVEAIRRKEPNLAWQAAVDHVERAAQICARLIAAEASP